MRMKTIVFIGSVSMLPALYVFNYAIRNWGPGEAIAQWLPKWDVLLIIAVMIVIERLYRYTNAVSQRHVLSRDLVSSGINLYVTGALTGLIVVPVLALVLNYVLGRELLFASPEQLGPFWLQLPAIVLFVSLFRYWMHRLQHKNAFLWELHSYHHRVTDLRALNTLVSHPIDFSLRNVLPYLVLAVIGFDAIAILFAVPLTQIGGIVSHCGANLKGGYLNYVLMTPEVHRWHHSAVTPEGHKYAVNYGVEFSFWDILFRTYYLPNKEGRTELPNRLGHPGGLPDERDYLKLLLAPLGLYWIIPGIKRIIRVRKGPPGPQTAE